LYVGLTVSSAGFFVRLMISVPIIILLYFM
jgi:hypothetical protein